MSASARHLIFSNAATLAAGLLLHWSVGWLLWLFSGLKTASDLLLDRIDRHIAVASADKVATGDTTGSQIS